MTATMTVSCPQGIVLATDRRITVFDEHGRLSEYRDDVDKIFKLSKLPIGLSYWGLASFGNKHPPETMLDRLAQFDKELVTEHDDVSSISEKLTEFLEGFAPKIEIPMGIHLAGYSHDGNELYPQLRHVFHARWQEAGEFINENSNREYHTSNGEKQIYKYDPFIALFNGDKAIANALFNFLPQIYPTNGPRIILDLLSLDESIRLAKLVINTTDEMLNLLYTLDQKKPIAAVRGLMIAKITPQNGFEWVKKDSKRNWFTRMLAHL